MLKCLNCGHIFKSNIKTEQTRCSSCGKASFIQVDKINEAVVADIEILKKQMLFITKRLDKLEGRSSTPTPIVKDEPEPTEEPTEESEITQQVEPEPVQKPEHTRSLKELGLV